MRSLSDTTRHWTVLVDAMRTRLWPVPAAAAVLSRLFSLLRELPFVTTTSAHHRAISDQLERLHATVRDGRFDDGQHRRFAHEGHQVAAAFAGQWPGTRSAG